MTLRMGELFAGYGGLGMGVGQVLDVDLAWVSEIEPAPSRVLAHHWPDVPNLGDITAVDWSQVEPVDVLTGGFPCQDVSAAGKRAGLKPGTRSGLWSHMAYAIDQLRPRLVVAENVRGLLSAEAHCEVEPCPWCVGDGSTSSLRALGAVLGDLAELGYDASWYGLRAADVGAPHGRFRVFVVAWPAADAGGQRLVWRASVERGGWDATERVETGHHASDTGSACPTADADDIGQQRRRPARNGRTGPADGSLTAADTRRQRGERRRGNGDVAGPTRAGEAHREQRERDGHAADDRGATAPDAESQRRTRCEQPRQDVVQDGPQPAHPRASWGAYEPAIRRWEHILGRVAPAPTERGPKGGDRLSPRFVEWMMGPARRSRHRRPRDQPQRAVEGAGQRCRAATGSSGGQVPAGRRPSGGGVVTYSSSARRITFDTSSPFSLARATARSQMSSGTRTVRRGVLPTSGRPDGQGPRVGLAGVPGPRADVREAVLGAVVVHDPLGGVVADGHRATAGGVVGDAVDAGECAHVVLRGRCVYTETSAVSIHAQGGAA